MILSTIFPSLSFSNHGGAGFDSVVTILALLQLVSILLYPEHESPSWNCAKAKRFLIPRLSLAPASFPPGPFHCTGDGIHHHDIRGHGKSRFHEAPDISHVQLPLLPHHADDFHLHTRVLHLHHPYACLWVSEVTTAGDDALETRTGFPNTMNGVCTRLPSFICINCPLPRSRGVLLNRWTHY